MIKPKSKFFGSITFFISRDKKCMLSFYIYHLIYILWRKESAILYIITFIVVVCFANNGPVRHKIGTAIKRQVSKRQVSKRLVSKRLKRQVYKTSALQNVRFTKCQVVKTSGLQNVRLQKRTSIYILYLWFAGSVAAMFEGCVLFSILEGFFSIYHHNR